jgi:threonine synthase
VSSDNPFLRFRWLLDSYAAARQTGWSDADFVALVERLDQAVAGVEGHGFVVTPTTSRPALAEAVGVAGLWVKDDTGNVGGSHKARHLFGVLLHLAVEERSEGELVIASCGNAALAAAVVARAAERTLRVFIPTWADPAVVGRLDALGATIEVCERRHGEQGDPTYLRQVEALARGAVPFSCQSTVTPTTLDGGRTIGWELAEQLGLEGLEGPLHLFVQVGGGALAASAWAGVKEGCRQQWLAAGPILHPVQTEACAPLVEAWNRLQQDTADPDEMASLAHHQPDRYMRTWPAVGTSAASGILDDITYDWLPILDGMLESGGSPVLVSEDRVVEANEMGRLHTGIDVDATGTAGLAGVIERCRRLGPDATAVVLFTGISRG